MPNLNSASAHISAPRFHALIYLFIALLYAIFVRSSLVTTEDAKNIVNYFSPANIITVYLYTVASEI